ncbi:MAG: hypothetical protein HQM10_00030 [Candidatus Riflebacteria bacterium]|nr:hypothetical protein [Candidatus Riflebacteria bacterium]
MYNAKNIVLSVALVLVFFLVFSQNMYAKEPVPRKGTTALNEIFGKLIKSRRGPTNGVLSSGPKKGARVTTPIRDLVGIGDNVVTIYDGTKWVLDAGVFVRHKLVSGGNAGDTQVVIKCASSSWETPPAGKPPCSPETQTGTFTCASSENSFGKTITFTIDQVTGKLRKQD